MNAADLALLVLRVTLGGIYVAHGARKLGAFGGKGFGGWVASIDRRGMRPPALWAAAAAVAEIVGGTFVVIGLLTPVGAALLVAQSAVITWLVRAKGFWHTQEGVEYPLMLGAAALAVALLGPGAISLDAALGLSPPAEWRVALIAGAVGVGLAGLLSRRRG